MTLNHVESKTKIDGGEIRRLDTFQIGRYSVNRVTVMEGTKVTYKNISVTSREEYAPEIVYDDNFWTGEKSEFKIQTRAYGSKDVAEIEKIIAGYQEAVEVVKILTMNFC